MCLFIIRIHHPITEQWFGFSFLLPFFYLFLPSYKTNIFLYSTAFSFMSRCKKKTLKWNENKKPYIYRFSQLFPKIRKTYRKYYYFTKKCILSFFLIEFIILLQTLTHRFNRLSEMVAGGASEQTWKKYISFIHSFLDKFFFFILDFFPVKVWWRWNYILFGGLDDQGRWHERYSTIDWNIPIILQIKVV